MANQLYNPGRSHFLQGNIHWLTDDIQAILVDTADYTFALGHAWLSDVPALARVATSPPLTGKTAGGGIADANDVTFSSVSGDPAEAIIIYRVGSLETNSHLIAYIDTVTSGLPVTPNGGDIYVVWDDGANKIFKL